jgi:osmotically-inducible protein OsmY
LRDAPQADAASENQDMPPHVLRLCDACAPCSNVVSIPFSPPSKETAMANRNQNYQSGPGSGRGQDYGREPSRRGRDDDEGRYSSAEDDRSYGSYADTDEGDSSVRAGSYDQGRGRYGGRDTREQSGSTGRYAGYGDFGQGDYSGGRRGFSGQDRYGQSGYGQGGYGQGAQGEYRGGNYWREPYGEGQQYSSSGQYAGESAGQPWAQGPHRGKGPKGYQRSDERLKELICERLRDDPQIDPSEVTVTVQSGKITLEGTVDSRQAKNAIEDIAEQFGVEDVQNNLRVQRVSQSGESTGRSASGKSGTESSPKQNKH